LGQIAATFGKTIREFLRQKTVLFWTIAWPVIWVLLGCFSFTSSTPDDILSQIRGSITISMTVFALMTAVMGNLPGNIAADRERGLLSKLKTMPVSPWRDLAGRILALLAFSSLAVIAVASAGYACGARLTLTMSGAWQSIGFLLLISVASAGIGMLIGTFVKHVHGAIMTGVGITVVSAAISGLMTPYTSLPAILQEFARIYPVSSASSSIIFVLVGEEYAGYNPLNPAQTGLTLLISLLLFVVGLNAYSRSCWKKD
jgi:ABC-2 type transport system permease protein